MSEGRWSKAKGILQSLIDHYQLTEREIAALLREHLPPEGKDGDVRRELINGPLDAVRRGDRVKAQKPFPPVAEGHLLHYQGISYLSVPGGFLRGDGQLVRQLPDMALPLQESHEIPQPRASTHDGTLAGMIAAPIWAALYYLTGGGFGRPMTAEE